MVDILMENGLGSKSERESQRPGHFGVGLRVEGEGQQVIG